MTIDEFRRCPEQDVPVVFPAGSRTIQSGYSAFLYDRTDHVDKYDPNTGIQVAPSADIDSDWARVQPLSTAAKRPLSSSVYQAYTKAPLVNSAQFQKQINNNFKQYILRREKIDQNTGAVKLERMMGIKKIKRGINK
jgi:hypothetical protein